MEITKIELAKLQVPFKKPYLTSGGVGTTATQIIVKVHTDEEIIGLGETEAFAKLGCSPEMAMQVIAQLIGPAILGHDPLNIHEIYATMDKTIRHMNPPKAAIDIACYDILGKKAGLPVYTLLGGKARDFCFSCWPIGATDPESAAKDALWAKSEGYTTASVKAGSTVSVEDDIARIAAVREAVGKEFILMTDANEAWNMDRAIKYGRAIEKYGPVLFEQPLPAWDIDGMAKIKSKINIPFSCDEGAYDKEHALMYCRKNAVDVISVKPCKQGGITKTWEIINATKDYGVTCLTNTMAELGIIQSASFHMALASTNYCNYLGHGLCSPMRLKEDITDYADQYKAGKVAPNGKPGLGVTLKEDVVAKYTVEKTVIE